MSMGSVTHTLSASVTVIITQQPRAVPATPTRRSISTGGHTQGNAAKVSAARPILLANMVCVGQMASTANTARLAGRVLLVIM